MRTKIVLVLSSCFFAIDALANGGVWTTDDSMFAVWMVQFLAAVFLCVATGCFLHEHGINAFSKVRELLRQPVLVLTFLCMFVGASIQYAVSKVSPPDRGIDNGELRIENSEPMRSGNLQLPIFPSFPIVPNSQFSILNSQFTYINPQSNSVILGIGWPMANPPPEECDYSTTT